MRDQGTEKSHSGTVHHDSDIAIIIRKNMTIIVNDAFNYYKSSYFTFVERVGERKHENLKISCICDRVGVTFN